MLSEQASTGDRRPEFALSARTIIGPRRTLHCPSGPHLARRLDSVGAPLTAGRRYRAQPRISSARGDLTKTRPDMARRLPRKRRQGDRSSLEMASFGTGGYLLLRSPQIIRLVVCLVRRDHLSIPTRNRRRNDCQSILANDDITTWGRWLPRLPP